MTFITVQGNNKQAKNTMRRTSSKPLPSSTIKCMSEQELTQIVNFAPITPPQLKNATVKLKFKKTGQDTVQWKGKITIGAGHHAAGPPGHGRRRRRDAELHPEQERQGEQRRRQQVRL